MIDNLCNQKKLIILGAGGFGQTVRDLASQTRKYSRSCFLDDHSDANDVIGKLNDYLKFIDGRTEFIVALGNNAMRRQWLETLAMAKAAIATLVHVRAYISPTAKVENGCIVLPQAVVNTNCALKRGCIVNIGAIVDHGCILEECVHVAPGGIVKAENRIPALMKIESGVVVKNHHYSL